MADQLYRTIVADPPWAFDRTGVNLVTKKTLALPYASMSVEQIASLPVATLAELDAHLYLWTPQRYVEQAYSICRRWEFQPSSLLVWCKRPMGWMPGGIFASGSVEFVLFARRGSLTAKNRVMRQWWEWARAGTGRRGASHSVKPEAFLDMVEQVSPGPYLELFARRQRLGWDTWGDEALNHVGRSEDSS